MENAESKSKKLRKAIFALLWTDAAILLPCFVSSAMSILSLLAEIGILSGTFGNPPEIAMIALAVTMIAFVLSRCFFLPEIMFAAAAILQIFYFAIAIKSKLNFKKRTAVFCVILDIFCIIALFSAQSVFDAAMSV